jgi:hypothetical protein
MRRFTPIRLLTCAVLAGTASLAIVLPSGIASAKAPKPTKEVCTTLTGNATSQTLSGCSGATGITSGVSNVATSTVTWNNGNTSTETYTYSEKTGTKDKCSPPAGDTNVAEVKESGTVTGGTETVLTKGKIKGTVCVFTDAHADIIVVSHGSQDL